MTGLMAGSTIAMICGGVFALGLGALGAVLIVLYLRNKNKGKASQSWPSTDGKIISTSIRLHKIYDEDSTRVRFIPQVHFTYNVNGALFEGKRIIYGTEPDFGSKEKAQDFLTAYTEGSFVKVFFNPENPTEAVLSQGVRKMGATLIVGIILIVLMVCLLCPIAIGLVRTLTGS